MRPSTTSNPNDISIHVLLRFALRSAILAGFAGLSTTSYGRSLAALLWIAIISCAGIAALRRETLFGLSLNYWDEMVGYAALFCIARELDQVASGG